MGSVTEIGGVLEALQAGVRSVGEELGGRWRRAERALEDVAPDVWHLENELDFTAGGYAHGGADVVGGPRKLAGRLRELAGEINDLETGITNVLDAAGDVRRELGPLARSLKDIADRTSDPDGPADAAGGAKGGER
jgi:hypothetical protein